MKDQIQSYFVAEKVEGLIGTVVGVLAIALSVTLWVKASPYRGMAFPLVLVGLLQIGVFGSVYLRTDRQVAELSAQLEASPATFKVAEIPRMETVMKNFRTYKLVEIAILLAGIVMTFVWKDRDMLYSAGVGCILQGSLMLVADLLAEHRGEVYLKAVRDLVP
jgi:membrane protein CcdC involved in cytochrome C biogenesis